jgi:hypothetical protein
MIYDPGSDLVSCGGLRDRACLGGVEIRAEALMWIPSTSDLETLVEHAAARVHPAVTAKALGVAVEDLRTLADRLAWGRAPW